MRRRLQNAAIMVLFLGFCAFMWVYMLNHVG